jgi:hypothetical protein
MSAKSLALPFMLMLVVAACVGFWCGRPALAPVQADERAAADAGTVDIYDADKDHLWNRLHAALYVRLTTTRGPNEELVPQDHPERHAYELDPMLWQQSRYLLTGPGHKPAVAVLDEFLAKNGEKVIKDPLKRALLQRDLWALFDSVLANPAWFDYTEYEKHKKDPYKTERAELATRVLKVMRRVALTREQIEALPDNYDAAVRIRWRAARLGARRPQGRSAAVPVRDPRGPGAADGADRRQGRNAGDSLDGIGPNPRLPPHGPGGVCRPQGVAGKPFRVQAAAQRLARRQGGRPLCGEG